MEIIKTAVLILICVLLVNSIPFMDKSISTMVSVTTAIIVFLYVLKTVYEPILQIKLLIDNLRINDFSLLFKVVGVSVISRFVGDIAADNGNKTLANIMNFTGKTAILIIALPLLEKVLEIIGRLIS